MTTITYGDIADAVATNKACFRAEIHLEPADGPGGRVFPPTYEGGKYATENRRINGETVPCVVLGSVADQANRQELALLDQRELGASIPVVVTDFSGTEVGDLGTITSLEASHRCFDALFRDSLDGDTLFRKSATGTAISEASDRNAGALLSHDPAAILFGAWDSTGPKGGLGAKFERAITTEIAAINVAFGAKTTSRIDVLGIEKAQNQIFEAEDSDLKWTLEQDQAAIASKKPKLYGKKGAGELGRPSQINHGNVVPSITPELGGITADYITSTTVLSLLRLRQLKFPVAADGSEFSPEQRIEAELAARSALAALGLLGLSAAVEGGFDLRSRCVLIPEESPTIELVGTSLQDKTTFELSSESARSVLGEAVAKVNDSGLAWNDQDTVLTPRDDLVTLVVNSRDIHAVSDSE